MPFELAQHACHFVLDMLEPQDRLGLVSLGAEAAEIEC